MGKCVLALAQAILLTRDHLLILNLDLKTKRLLSVMPKDNSGHSEIPMVAEPSDPTAAHHAIAMAAAGMMGAGARGASPLGTMVSDDFEISDDSFTKTPSPLKKNLKREQRLRSIPRKRGASSLPRGTRAASVGAAGGRGMPRPPSPAIKAAPQEMEHQLAVPADTSAEARLEALERQQKLDHTHFVKLNRTFMNVFTVIEHYGKKFKEVAQGRDEQAQLGLNLRREVYAMRDKLEADMKEAGNVITSHMPAIIDQASTALTARIMASETLLEQLKETTTKQGNYLNELHDARPKEGQAVVETFQRMDQEFGRVKNMVNQLEGKNVSQAIFPQGSTVLNKEMLDALADMHVKVNSMAQLYQSYAVMFQKVEHNALLSEALSNSCAEFVKRFDALDEHIINDGPQQDGGAAQWQAGMCGSSMNAAAPAWNSGAPSCCPPGMPASSGAGDVGRHIHAIIEGNGRCHCVHVKELMEKFAAMETGDPWHRGTPPRADGGRAQPGGAGGTASTVPAAQAAALPLKLCGPIGAIGYKDRSLFDDKLTMQEEFRFYDVKGGPQWKGRIERYFISKAPILKGILDWAEEKDRETIDVDLLRKAIGRQLTEDQILTMNAAIWGFLSGALHGTAETIFKRAEPLNGIESWRRIVRFIDHGREIRLETLRREVKMLHLKPIKEIEAVEEGVAEFENTILEYEQAGGTAFQDGEMKSDLLAILPAALRENLLWQASDTGTFQKFRDMVVAQAAKVAMNRRKMAVNHLHDEAKCEDEEQPGIDMASISNVEDFIAAVNRMWKSGAGGRRQGGQRQDGQRDDRPPRKCPNCGKTHAERKCPEPPVAPGDRKCWSCNKKGHTSSACPDKKRSPVKAIEDGPAPFFGQMGCNMIIDDDGGGEFNMVRRGGRPRPHQPTLGDYISANTYSALSNADAPTPKKSAAGRDSSSTPTSTSSSSSKPAKTRAKCVQQAHEDKIINEALLNIEKAVQQEENVEDQKIAAIFDEEDAICAATEEVAIRVAMDSGSVGNVISPDELPYDAKVEVNKTGRHFVGAGGGRIQKFGKCNTKLVSQHGEIGCGWQVADVTRPLHSVSEVTGPIEGDGLQDVLFNNKSCFVVPPGIVKEIMKKVKPVAEYGREGGLYVADMKMTSFHRQGQDA